jgi:hypothetical protein
MIKPRRRPADYRISGRPAASCRQPLQVHAGPQLQVSPYWHDAVCRGAGVWQPHLHSEPGHTAHAQPFD